MRRSAVSMTIPLGKDIEDSEFIGVHIAQAGLHLN